MKSHCPTGLDYACEGKAVWGAQEIRRILAYQEPVDLRKSFPGLVGWGKGVLAEDPLSGTVFVFINQQGTLIKSVYWDRTGFLSVRQTLRARPVSAPGGDAHPGTERASVPGPARWDRAWTATPGVIHPFHNARRPLRAHRPP
jgi:hypothetical protein